MTRCTACRGTGADPASGSMHYIPCSACGGTGVAMETAVAYCDECHRPITTNEQPIRIEDSVYCGVRCLLESIRLYLLECICGDVEQVPDHKLRDELRIAVDNARWMAERLEAYRDGAERAAATGDV